MPQRHPKGPRPVRITIIRYEQPDGTRCAKGEPGARKRKERSDTYYARLPIDGSKPKPISLGTTDLGRAWAELRRLQKREADRAAGIRDDYTDQAERPLGEHIADWTASVTNKGSSDEHVQSLRARVSKLAILADWKRLGDLASMSCLDALARLQSEEDLSAQTRNHYTRAAKQFSRWCCRTRPRRLREDPFDIIGLVNVETDRRHDRRAPTDEEVALLFEFLQTVPDDGRRWRAGRQPKSNQYVSTVYWRRGMSAPQRALGYKVAMASGIRAGELRSLSRASFDIERGTLSVRAGYSKRRRLDTIELPGWLVEDLRTWFAAGGDCWEGFPAEFPGRLLQDDLEAARLAWIAAAAEPSEQKRRAESDVLRYQVAGPNGPLFLDFHALRHWYCSWAANLPGISPRALMALCRHSTATLTLKTYSKARQHDLRAAVDQMPAPGGATRDVAPGRPEGGKSGAV